jgi:predicted hydrocarbon binding protein
MAISSFEAGMARAPDDSAAPERRQRRCPEKPLTPRLPPCYNAVRQQEDLMLDALTSAAVRLALVGGSLANKSLFWVRAALGENQLRMHECTADGSISIGGVPEQLYGEGFIAAWHEVFERELGPRAPLALYEAGRQGGRWEVRRAIERGVWVPRFLAPYVGRKDVIEAARRSPVFHALLRETMRIFLRMIVTEGGWGVIEELDLRATPARLVVRNAPEPRRLGRTGRCSCDLFAGITSGYFEGFLAVPCAVRETACESRGDRACAFEIDIDAPLAREAAEPARRAEPLAATGARASS